MHKWSERKTPSKPACSAIRAQARIVVRLDCGPILRIATPNFIAIPPATSLVLKKDWQARAHPVKLLGHWEPTTRGSSICDAAQALQSRRDPRRGRPRVPRARL